MVVHDPCGNPRIGDHRHARILPAAGDCGFGLAVRKIKTVLQVLAIFLLLIPWDYFYVLNPANRGWASVALMSALCVAGTALAATLWSGIAYVREGLILAREVRDPEPQNEA